MSLPWIAATDPVMFARQLGFEPDEKQKQVLDRRIHYGILNCSRQWGKSTVTSLLALHRAWSEPGALVVAASPSARQSGEYLRKVTSFARELGLKTRGDGHNRLSLALPNGSRIVALPGMEGTLRGFSAVSLLLIDEASRVSDELYYALTPMLAATDGDLWLMSTPAGKRGFFWKEWTEGGEDWVRISAPATECARIHPRFLEKERARMGDRRFRQEYLCEFTQSADSFFSEEDIRACIRHDVPALWEDEWR